MAERNYPRDFTGLLPVESARWVSQGLISEAERASILKLYPDPTTAGRDRTVLIFSILGSLLLAAGVILFFAANWPRISAAVKVTTIMGAILGTYAAGYYLTYKRDDYPRLGQSLILLGGLLYGGGIWLIAQIFHMDSHFPTGFLLWGLGVLPVAWATASNPMLYLSTVLLTVWTISEQSGFNTINYVYPLLLLLFVQPLARRLGNWLSEGTVLACVFAWFAINVAQRGFAPNTVNNLMVVGRLMLLYGVAITGFGLAGLGDIRAYLAVGSIGSLGGAFMLTFASRSYLGAQLTPGLFAGSPYLITGTIVILIGMATALWLYWRRGERDRLILAPILALLALAGMAANLPAEESRLLLFNVLLFATTVGLIVYGVNRRIGWLVYLGLIAFMIHMLTRYFDLFYTAMSRSGFFMLGGLLLLGGGWLLERNRRRWMGGDGNAR